MAANELNLFLLFFGAIFVSNIVLLKFLALCPFIGVSSKIETALGMGFAVIFVMLMASTVSWFIYHFVLAPYGLVYLRTGAFILIIAALVQFVEMFVRKVSPALYRALAIFLPLITTNCAILGLAFMVVDKELSLVQTLVYAFGVALGFTLAIVLLAGIRERLESAPVPQAFKGAPIVFITAALMSLAFLGFSNLFGISL